jgi:hypothetical protein
MCHQVKKCFGKQKRDADRAEDYFFLAFGMAAVINETLNVVV